MMHKSESKANANSIVEDGILSSLLRSVKFAMGHSTVKFQIDGQVFSTREKVPRPAFRPDEVFKPGQWQFEILAFMQGQLDGSHNLLASSIMDQASRHVPIDWSKGKLHYKFAFNRVLDQLFEYGYIQSVPNTRKEKMYQLTKKGRSLANSLVEEYKEMLKERAFEMAWLPLGFARLLDIEGRKIYKNLIDEELSYSVSPLVESSDGEDSPTKSANIEFWAHRSHRSRHAAGVESHDKEDNHNSAPSLDCLL